MTELQLQSEIAVKHSQKYPEKWGQLFHISNERANRKQAYLAKSIGIVPGVADFIYLDKKFNAATEIKVDGSSHEIAKLKAQVRWGKVWEKMSKKNNWRMCFTSEQALNCYEGNFEGYTIKQVSRIIKNAKHKSITLRWQENF
ncbi:hypothetical protein Phi47:1_gp37 [Cellulophaga phage phi47:1]|uniref:hypothetical protein n=1 Tax=Cellulophaga phage phiSM TaxID=756280 RepID=UPI0002B794F2|nr:hypothetical protein CEPG_00037 [Cellulophaga phage phiSM]AGF91633.1 hypothetical protein CDPG_00029 [Cellulophaga phage phi47:1]AGO47768.1 hypothetical protein Phi3ST:2_gp37 [Cellulophaga phage phi3ST:2]AGO49276.1 hypothetical protein Phi38:2_gp37 [Cellulophaga phage phi38:2]AGO49356.1 hypothetical protein Phi3:1_gp37 [Cellulophaga phage phi3:1]AGH07785.1 hypothetical protein CEPG_00037 [Cellulophaga phage phiSM]